MRRIPAVLLSLALSWMSAAQDGAPASPGPAPLVPLPSAAIRPLSDALPAPVLPKEIRLGDALVVWVPRPGSDGSGEAVLRSPAGTALQSSGGFRVRTGPGWEGFVFGLPADAPAGVYTVEIPGASPDSSRLPVTVRPRDFRAEDIPLGEDLTSLRTVPSPRKDREARVYGEVLATTDPRGVWLDGPFLRPVGSDRRTSHFGDRRRYLYATGGTAASVHAGIDFAAPTGTPVVAAGRGRVVLAEDREVTGKTVVLEHLPGVYTIYMHLDTLAAVPGSVLERGAPLGTVGSTGLATGPHLHWELRVRGVACDPETRAFVEFPPGP